MRPFTIIFLILMLNSVVNALSIDKVKSLFDSGYYNELLEFTAELKDSPEKDPSASLLRGVSLFRKKNYRESKKYLKLVLERPGNDYIKDHALYYTALSRIKLDEDLQAALILTKLLNSTDKDIRENSDILLENIIYYRFSGRDYTEFKEDIFNHDILSIVKRSERALKILAVLPLTGIDKEAGRDILKGLRFGIENYDKENQLRVKLDILNSESDITVMTGKVIGRLNSSRYNLIIGELRSNTTAALAGIASLKNIPLISPTAADKDISEISSFVYQMNTTSYTLGKKIAQYAVDSLNYKTFVTLAPLNKDGNESVEGFTEEVINKGCGIINAEWYFEAYDINRQLKRIRENIFSIDSLDLEEYMSDDSIKSVPAGIVDAFFLPVPEKDLESVISQVAFYNFKAKILGTYGWDNKKILNKLSRNLDSLVFITESRYDINDTKYNDFVYRFRNRNDRNPKLLEITGYAVIEMLINLQKENPERSIRKNLSELREYNSVNGKIKFKDSRSNYASNLFLFRSGRDLISLDHSDDERPDSLNKAKILYNKAYVYDIKHRDSLAAFNYKRSLREYREVINNIDSIDSYRPLVQDILLKTADSYYEMTKMDSALVYYEKVLVPDSSDKDIIFKTAKCRIDSDPQKALDIFQSFTSDSLFSSDAYFEIGKIHLKNEDTDKAQYYFEMSADMDNQKAVDILKKLEERKEENKINFEW